MKVLRVFIVLSRFFGVGSVQPPLVDFFIPRFSAPRQYRMKYSRSAIQPATTAVSPDRDGIFIAVGASRRVAYCDATAASDRASKSNCLNRAAIPQPTSEGPSRGSSALGLHSVEPNCSPHSPAPSQTVGLRRPLRMSTHPGFDLLYSLSNC